MIEYHNRKSKKVLWSIVRSSPIFDEEGKVQYVVNVVSDITEQKELERRKDEFLSIASHELKTPLTSIKGFAYLTQRILAKSKNEKAISYVSRINQYTDRMNSLISDLLDVSKIQAGKLQFHKEPFVFDEMVKETITDMQANDDIHYIDLKGSTNLTIAGDRERLGQVITNLLSNAAKYSPNAKRIVVKLAKKEQDIEMSVRDFGVGIPKNKVRKIFERFYRVDETASQFSGLGIGLHISKEIITRHNGKIWAESEFGKGSTFFFTLPIGK